MLPVAMVTIRPYHLHGLKMKWSALFTKIPKQKYTSFYRIYDRQPLKICDSILVQYV